MTGFFIFTPMIPNKYLPYYKSTGLCTDSRLIEKDNLFVCINGEKFDANKFAQSALDSGASHVIVDNPEYCSPQEEMTLVENSIEYLQELANFHRKQFNIPVIGITGSNGKTTSKELIKAVLSKKFNVLATEGNLNNHLGVPFTLLRMNDEHDLAIIEMGANKSGDIRELCEIAEPNYGIITNIGKAHLEGFINFEGVLKTKTELYKFVESTEGKLFINSEDSVLTNNTPESVELIKFGKGSKNIEGELVKLTPFVQMKWSLGDYTSPTLKTNLVGKYNFTNFLAAIAIGNHLGVPAEMINEAISEYTPTNNRSQVNETGRNTLIMDCYNANPTSMKNALESFAEIEHTEKLAILGDMKELGDESSKEHELIIDQLNEYDLPYILVGSEFNKLKAARKIGSFADTEALIKFLEEKPITKKLILLKGSRGIGLEKASHLL
jgi:UDP-N-acetylmuramoyl-tripeptide--D-alanyl-D-alanine ligase